MKRIALLPENSRIALLPSEESKLVSGIRLTTNEHSVVNHTVPSKVEDLALAATPNSVGNLHIPSEVEDLALTEIQNSVRDPHIPLEVENLALIEIQNSVGDHPVRDGIPGTCHKATINDRPSHFTKVTRKGEVLHMVLQQ